ncbi:MAG: hypothetical protein J5934_02380 [Succinivibrio sp.]|nr:hypothetical protein [Succinivibrio sp.]
MDKIFKDKTNVPARLEYVVERTWIPEGEDMDGRGSCFVTKRPQEPKY